MEQKTGLFATLSILFAVGSYILSFSARPFWGLLTALISIPLGGVGLIRAASPRVSGGLLSIAAIVLGVAAIGVAVLVLIGVLIF